MRVALTVLVLFIGLSVSTAVAMRFPPSAAAAVEAVEEAEAIDWAADDLAAFDAQHEAAERVIDADLESDETESEDESTDESSDESEDLELMELDVAFAPFQAAANVAPFNMAVDPGHNFMNPFIRGYNPSYDGFTPQPGGQMWNNPSGPNWSPFGWSAPASYWSVYPPQYASHYVNPGMYHAPGMHQFLGPNYYGGHYGHAHGPLAAFPYGSQDPHVYGPHLDWPFGALTSDMDHVPGMGTGVNVKAAFPQFRQVFESEEETSDDAGSTSEEVDASDPTFVESESSASTSMPAESVVGDALNDADAAMDESNHVSEAEYSVDATNHIIPLRQQCVNCAYSN